MGLKIDIFDVCYVIRKSVAVEDFDDGSLIFLLEERRLIKTNRIARDILRYMDGKRTIRKIIQDIASTYGTSFDSVYQDVSDILADLADRCIIRDVDRLARIKDYNDMEDIQYSINHDVSCRIEQSDGAILYNPQSDAVQVVNPTGLAIWQALAYPRRKHEIVEYLLDVCEDVPEDQVVQDVDEFIEKLKSAGFIGEAIE